MTDLRVIHAGLSPRLTNVVVDVLRKERERDDVTHPAHARTPDERQMLDAFHDYLVGELHPPEVERPAPEPARAKRTRKAKAEPAAKTVARKMAKAGAKAAA